MNTVRTSSRLLVPPADDGVRRRVERIIRQLVPSAADFCLVHLAAKGSIRAVAGAHAARDGERLLRLLMRSYRISPGDGVSGVASVMRTRRPLLRTAIQIDAAVVRRGDQLAVDLHRQLAPRCAIVVPILMPFAVIGAVTLCYSRPGRTYSARDIPAAERIAERIAAVLVPPALFAPHATDRATRRAAPFRRRTARS